MDGARVRFWNGIKINAASFLVLGRKQEPRRKMKTNKEKENTCWRTNWWHVSWADKDYELIRKTSIRLGWFQDLKSARLTNVNVSTNFRASNSDQIVQRLKTICATTQHHLQLVDQCACVQQRSNLSCGELLLTCKWWWIRLIHAGKCVKLCEKKIRQKNDVMWYDWW